VKSENLDLSLNTKTWTNPKAHTWTCIDWWSEWNVSIALQGFRTVWKWYFHQ